MKVKGVDALKELMEGKTLSDGYHLLKIRYVDDIPYFQKKSKHATVMERFLFLDLQESFEVIDEANPSTP